MARAAWHEHSNSEALQPSPRTHSFQGESVTQFSVNTELWYPALLDSVWLWCLQLCNAHHDKYTSLHPRPIRGPEPVPANEKPPVFSWQLLLQPGGSCNKEGGILADVVVVVAVVRARACHQSPAPGSGTTPARRGATVWEHFINRGTSPVNKGFFSPKLGLFDTGFV